ncbi:MAG: hypothetical protein PBU97_13955 [Stenotrophomonas maltophilia]
MSCILLLSDAVPSAQAMQNMTSDDWIIDSPRCTSGRSRPGAGGGGVGGGPLAGQSWVMYSLAWQACIEPVTQNPNWASGSQK